MVPMQFFHKFIMILESLVKKKDWTPEILQPLGVDIFHNSSHRISFWSQNKITL